MNIFLDNIIFSLQKTGGISVVWQELLQRILVDPEFNPYFFEMQNENNFRKYLEINPDKIVHNSLSKLPINLQRFINPSLDGRKGIFHSSYYRIVKNKGIINVTTLHDFTYEHCRKGFAKIIHHKQKEIAIKNSKRIICVSNSTKSDLLKFYPKITPNHISVIYNGVSNNYKPLLKKEEADLSKIIDFSSNEYVLYVGGRGSKYKNFISAVKACRIAKVPLVLIGGGTLSNFEHSFLETQLGSYQYKSLLGISNEQLNIIYNNALCLLYPSVSEGFGIPIIEAQRVGCPVIATNYSSLPEIAGKGAILLTEITEHHIADTINLVKRDSTIIENLVEEGFKNSKRFSWDKCYQETKQVYKEVHEEYLSK